MGKTVHGIQQQALCAPRDVKQLKKLWDNMKQRWKREKAKQIRDVLTTGGVPPPPPMDERLAQIESIVPHLTTRVTNPFDSDRPLATPAAQSASEILNGMICENGPADSDEAKRKLLSQVHKVKRQQLGQVCGMSAEAGCLCCSTHST
ncbi:hypothetical protein HPB52_004396 [Rhipicephalus sanguineus]|uniref:Regulatory protein zeste n=1 Tax=Rhipicephalus sanguineus TaxID=34632 RepID=A0A9D4Q4R7_RHISA|nr:hypothetical protein HPB52_004396 [Rhipicephalus sanguineus]